MKLLLISINQLGLKDFNKAADISSLGARYISSYLKSIGHEVDILFLCKTRDEKETEAEIVKIIELVEKTKPDLIGVSLMSNHFFRAVAITKAIKKKGGFPPVIWGGIHPIIKPRECLKYADLICVGEGELAMKKLMDNLDNFKDLDIEGIWYKDGGNIIEGKKSLLISDIDGLPYPDYDLDNQYILHQGKIPPLSAEILQQYFPALRGDHRLISTRGCPHACSYCCSSVFKSIYGRGYMRQRSVDNFIAEMVEIKNKFSFVKSFKIMDDTFVSNSLDWMREFNEKYKQKVNLPFFCLVSPLTITKEKLDLLVDAGLGDVQIGFQSGSNRINREVYLRFARSNDFLKAIKLLEEYKGRLNFSVDAIVDNPYEEKEDLIQTINILNQVKKPFTLSIYSLVFYPGTALYNRAVADKLLDDNTEYLNKQFRLIKNNLFNKIIYLTPRLKKEKIGQLVSNHHQFLARFYINVLYFAITKKNKLPPNLSILISKTFKRFVPASIHR